MIASLCGRRAQWPTYRSSKLPVSFRRTLGGLGSATQQVLNLQVSATRSQSYIDAATLTNSKIQVMYSAVNSIADLATQFRALLTSATSASGTDAASVTESARNMLEQTASVLNTQYNGSYLFGGSETKTAPVDVSSTSYPAATSPSSADSSYYQGNSQLASVRVSDSQTVSYGVSADNTAFEKLMRAMNLAASNSPLTDTLNEALDLAVDAIDGPACFKSRYLDASTSIQNASFLASIIMWSASADCGPIALRS